MLDGISFERWIRSRTAQRDRPRTAELALRQSDEQRAFDLLPRKALARLRPFARARQCETVTPQHTWQCVLMAAIGRAGVPLFPSIGITTPTFGIRMARISPAEET